MSSSIHATYRPNSTVVVIRRRSLVLSQRACSSNSDRMIGSRTSRTGTCLHELCMATALVRRKYCYPVSLLINKARARLEHVDYTSALHPARTKRVTLCHTHRENYTAHLMRLLGRIAVLCRCGLLFLTK